MARTIEELREILRENNYNDEDISKYGKMELRSLVEKIESASAFFNDLKTENTVEIIPEEKDLNIISNSEIPKITDPKWTEYVISQLTEDEFILHNKQKMPKVDGLRRVATLLLGGFDTRVDVKQVPTVDNENRATVLVELQFDNGRVVSSSADVYNKNTTAKYAVHAVATAETRAEGRALRKALKLVKVIAAEELNGSDPEDIETEQKISSSLANTIELMAKKLDVNVLKIAQNLGFEINSIDQLTHGQGKVIVKELGNIQLEKNKGK